MVVALVFFFFSFPFFFLFLLTFFFKSGWTQEYFFNVDEQMYNWLKGGNGFAYVTAHVGQEVKYTFVSFFIFLFLFLVLFSNPLSFLTPPTNLHPTHI